MFWFISFLINSFSDSPHHVLTHLTMFWFPSPPLGRRGGSNIPQGPLLSKEGGATAPLVALSLGYSGIHKPSCFFSGLRPCSFLSFFALSSFSSFFAPFFFVFFPFCLGSASPLSEFVFLLALSFPSFSLLPSPYLASFFAYARLRHCWRSSSCFYVPFFFLDQGDIEKDWR